MMSLKILASMNITLTPIMGLCNFAQYSKQISRGCIDWVGILGISLVTLYAPS